MMHRYVIFSVLITLIIVLFCYSEGKSIIKPNHAFTTESSIMKLLSHKYHQRAKRDDTECAQDSLQNNPKKEEIEECERILDEIANTEDHYGIDNFCSKDCGNVLVAGIEIGQQDCGEDNVPGNPTQADIDMLAVACFKDPRGEYCMHETFNPSEDIFDSDYVMCRINNNGECTEECDRAITKVLDNFGCCYSYVGDLYGEQYVFPPSVMASCGYTFPAHCAEA